MYGKAPSEENGPFLPDVRDRVSPAGTALRRSQTLRPADCSNASQPGSKCTAVPWQFKWPAALPGSCIPLD